MFVFLISSEIDKVLLDTTKEKLEKFLSLNNLKCGLSIIFEDLCEIQDFFNEAIYSINLSHNNKNTNIFYFEKHIEKYLFYISQPENSDSYKIKLLNLINPLINKLRKFDNENKTELLNTLKTYVYTNKNANITANKLGIHRSTFFYRFNKIQNVIGISFNDFNNLFNLELSLKILDYIYE